MPEYIQSGVRERCKDPSHDTEVALIVGLDSSSEEEALMEIEQLGGDIEQRLPYELVAVSILEEHLESLCSIEGISSVEIEGESTIHTEENFRYHTDMIL